MHGVSASGYAVKTEFQRLLLATLSAMPNDDRYLAGGAAIHFSPNSTRYSDDLDFFHDSEARVASAFARDRETLGAAGYTVAVELSLPGLVRAEVSREGQSTRVDWAHDSAWRFMPLVRDDLGDGWVTARSICEARMAWRSSAASFVDRWRRSRLTTHLPRWPATLRCLCTFPRVVESHDLLGSLAFQVRSVTIADGADHLNCTDFSLLHG